MEILTTRVLNGPNYWSNYRKKLIVLKIDLKEFEEIPTNLIPSFPEKLVKLIPSLYSHHCSLGREGGFIERLQEGTWLGHVIEHVALELQNLAGMDCGYGRTRSTATKGVYNVVFSYEFADAGIYAGKTALAIIQSLIQSKPYLVLNNAIDHLKKISLEHEYGISTRSIIAEAEKRNIPYRNLNESSLIMFGLGCNRKLINATIGHQTSNIGVDIASDKALTKKILDSAFIPVPRGFVVENLPELEEALGKISFPIVIKPLDSNQGKGITGNIQTKEKAIEAFSMAQKYSGDIIVEDYIEGSAYRFLVVNYKLVAVAQCIPAFIIGDGVSSIKKLIEQENQNSNRGKDHENYLTKIDIDLSMISILKEKNLTLESILQSGERIYLKYTANISTGGIPIDVTNSVHSRNIYLAERIARLIHLDICGIDIIAKDVGIPIDQDNGVVLEVNASPGIRMHINPVEGQGRNVAKNILDSLFPPGAPYNIPIIAVTGTNGKTTTVRLIAHLADMAGYKTGFTTTDGVYIHSERIFSADCSGPFSAQAVLSDPMVEFAVLECARGGILQAGLGFNECDISILLNITGDHLGLDGIETIEDLVRVKSVVPFSTKKNGTAILNADDDLVYSLINELNCNIALFSLHADNPRVIQHCSQGGMAAFVENDFIIICRDNTKINFLKVSAIPLTYSGAACCMVKNILASILASILSQFKLEMISESLLNFLPSAENFPGRMNLYDFKKFRVLVDYAHNVDAFINLKNYMKEIQCQRKIGIIGSPGDRRPQDIINLGVQAAQIFDEIVIRHDEDSRGRANEEITQLLTEGARSYNPNMHIVVISNEVEALKQTIKHAAAGDFIVCCVDDVFGTIKLLQELSSKEKLEISYES